MRSSWLALLLMVLAFPAGGRASDFWDEVRTPGLHAHATRMQQVAAAVRRDDSARALELLAQVDPRFAGQAEVLVMHGLALAMTGATERAVALWNQALALDPAALDDPQWGARAAVAAAGAGELLLASTILARLVGTLPALPLRRELFAFLGDVLLAQGPDRLDTAIVAYREAMRGASPTDTRAHLGLALALSRHGDGNAARDVAQQLSPGARIDTVVAGLPVPASEKAARLALAAETFGNLPLALDQWNAAANGAHFREHAEASAARVRTSLQGSRARKVRAR